MLLAGSPTVIDQLLNDPLALTILGVIGSMVVTWLPLLVFLGRTFGRTEAQIQNLTDLVHHVTTDPNVVRWSDISELPADLHRTRSRKDHRLWHHGLQDGAKQH